MSQRDAVQRRLDTLEQQRQALTAGARGAERAALWLDGADRDAAMRRLRHITAPMSLALDTFADLRDSLDDAA